MPEQISTIFEKRKKNLYPPIEPFRQRILDTNDGHKIYIEECGNPEGIPVIVLHGGPGGGCSPTMRRYFDPDAYHVILFDQRGCGRSRPYASVENNTTWHLIDDIEKIRKLLFIDTWFVFGGSWGATLALLYAQAYPKPVSHLILRGIFTCTKSELDWFYKEGGAARFWPEAWKSFKGMIPAAEQSDLIKAYKKRLFGANPAEQAKFARAWTAWENALASLESPGFGSSPSTDYAKAFARLENHYFSNKGFLKTDNQIFNNLHLVKHIPLTIVQGRYDMICPPSSAQSLHHKWPESKLIMVPTAGHAMSEPGIASALIATMDKLKN